MVLRRCRRLLRDPEEAVDAMHDVFVEVLRREGSLRQVGSVSGMLFRTATNVCLNRLRSRRRRPESGAGEEVLEQIASLEEPEERAAARQLLDRLFGREPPSTRLLATLLFVDRMTLEEVAAEVGLSVSGVRKRVRTLRARLPAIEEV
jgi:RNA polymerase sigma-70 factor (ECF subfamily)